MWASPIRERAEKASWYLWLLFGCVTIGTLMINIDSSVLNIALPVLQEKFRAGSNVVQWTIIIYLLVSTGVLPLVGKLSDQLSRKKIFLLGVLLFVTGSLLCAISLNIQELIIFRGIQAFGSAFVMGNVMSMITHIFPESKRGRALGMIGSIVAAGTIAGPSIGGLLIDAFGWRSIFIINIPLGIISIIGVFIFLPSLTSNKTKQERLDWIGGGLFFIAMTTMLYYLSNGNVMGWLSWLGILLISLALIFWLVFFRWESKHPHPLIQFSFFRTPDFSIGMASLFMVYLLFMIPSLDVPLFMHNVLNIQVAHMGLIMTAQALAMFVFSPVSGWLTDKWGPFLPTIVGMTLISISLIKMTLFSVQTTDLGLILALILFGIGFSLFSSPNNVSILSSVPKENTGVVGSLIATGRNFGRVTGASLAILLLEVGKKLNGDSYTKGISFAFTVSVCLSLGTLMIVLMKLRVRGKVRGNLNKKI